MIKSNGGDLNYRGATLKQDKQFDINYGGCITEVNIDSIYVYYDSHYIYKNFL